MALTVTVGGASSDSYVSVSEYVSYHLRTHNRNLNTADNDILESNLRLSTQFLDSCYLWKGYPASKDQALQFPRIFEELIHGYYIDSEVIPKQIKNALCELSYAVGEGLEITPTIESGTVKQQSIAAGVAKVSTVYDQIFMLPKITAVELLISPYHNGSVLGGRSRQLLRG